MFNALYNSSKSRSKPTCLLILYLTSLTRGFDIRRFGSKSATTSNIRMSATTTKTYSTFEVAQFPCLNDNYGFLIHDPETGNTAAVDTPDYEAYRDVLEKRGWKLSHILCTHHHWDHTGANLDLKAKGVTIYGAEAEASKIPGIDILLKPNDTFPFGRAEVKVMDVGGHTSGHIAYYFEKDGVVFCGDALFALGCGRMFEGTADQFWASLKRLRELPDDTRVYCAHEYTLSNANFALSVEPSNEELVKRHKEVWTKRQLGEPTVPTTIGEEKRTNPFLRGDISPEIRRNVSASDSDDLDVVFGKIRQAKDKFRS